MTIYGQKDPRWKDLTIGGSTLTIGGWGCALCCVAMLASWVGATFTTPKEIAAHQDWFTADGLIYWGKIDVGGLRFDGRVRRFDQVSVLAAAMSQNRAALIEVELGEWRHWVVAVRWSPFLGWRVADPLTGTYRWMPKGWKPIGYAMFSKI